MANQPRRLCSDDFVALRSLAQSRWVQGLEIDWKFNRTWRSIRYTSAALDAAFRLVGMGLVENFVCCSACGEVFQLTEKGRQLVNRINRRPAQQSIIDEHRADVQELPQSGRWFHRLVQVFTARNRV